VNDIILAVGGASDNGLRGVAAISARVAYAFLCLTISWGVLTRTNWARRLGERKTFRSMHLVLATLTITFGCVHAMGFLFLNEGAFSFVDIASPFNPMFRYAIAIVGLELMIAIAATASLYRWTSYRRWQWVHRTAYVAFPLLVVHSVLGAIANLHLSILWLAGLTFFIPAVTLAILRFVPTRTLVSIGLVEEQV
jgi:sulfoxide reductase heme-binding subunit YedZ